MCTRHPGSLDTLFGYVPDSRRGFSRLNIFYLHVGCDFPVSLLQSLAISSDIARIFYFDSKSIGGEMINKNTVD